MIQPGFFDLSNRYEKLDKLGDPLPKIESIVDWEGFRPILETIRQKPRKSNAGRPPFDAVMMLKTLAGC